ncbi:3-phosphoshikimate 1-carboxyvinyltransferase [Faecalicoccus acidiformans]|uniref:3-phosphoshikimate 1-carboxyvinyltransferase n=1 Tax=Faecalicoccus acidiformans TaxID=915173 RepID=UPI0023570FA9|nr:3-phosphoshikimate 1-carboxyvinyltransferase [Faecalicoccus acidiformans]
MRVKIHPSKIHGKLRIPSSKSMAHRALICASLAEGTSTLSGIDASKDIEATIACMESLGAKIIASQDQIQVTGTNLKSQGKEILCPCNESGSTMRFLIPVASLTNDPVTFTGQGRLLERPMEIYARLFHNQGLAFVQDSKGIRIQGALKPDDITIEGNISSQFISGLLFALPLLSKESTITVLKPYESRSYVELTLEMLRNFGIRIEEISPTTYHIPKNQAYQAQTLPVEGDYSQAAFFAVLAALQEKLTLTNLKEDSRQGDKVILDHLENAGASLRIQNDTITIEHQDLRCQTIDLADCPDLGPILCVLASFCPGTTHFIHAGRLRIKESDRVQAMETELKKWGVAIQTTEDTITIHGKREYDCQNVVIDGHNDHRIVMAMTIFGLCAQTESVIEGAQAITKSYPAFFEDIQKIHGKVEIL